MKQDSNMNDFVSLEKTDSEISLSLESRFSAVLKERGRSYRIVLDDFARSLA